MKFSIKDFFSKCDQIRRKLQIWLHLMKKYFKKLHFYAVRGEIGGHANKAGHKINPKYPLLRLQQLII